MIVDLFNAVLYNPLYNGLIFLIEVVPYADVGLAVIALTVIVKLILFPLSIKAVRTQMVMKKLEKPLKELKEKYKKDPQELARKTMEIYRKEGLNPFSSILLLFIQIPIILALYWVFYSGGLPEINTEILYSFLETPAIVNMNFLGLVDMGGRSAIFALLAGVTQFFQARYSLPDIAPRKDDASMKEDLMRSMQIQMKYVLPIIVVVIAYTLSAAIALYWFTSNLFSIGQELYMRKNVKNQYDTKDEEKDDGEEKVRDAEIVEEKINDQK